MKGCLGLTSTKTNGMRFNQMRLFTLLGMVFLLLHACTKDEDFTVSESNFNSANGRTDGPNDREGRGGNEVAVLGDNVPLQWMNLFLELERYAAGMRPNASARAIAYINLAAYETALPGMRDFVSNSSLIPGFNLRDNGRQENLDWEIALNSCYARAMRHFLLNLPAGRATQIDELEETLEAQLGSKVDRRRLNESKEWGFSIADQVIGYSQSDAAAEQQILEPQPLSYEPPVGDGFWTYSAEQERALFPYWERVRTFVITPDETTTEAPLSYSENPSSPYYQEMLEVYEDNNAAADKDDEQLWIAEFWSDDVENLTFSPPARQISIAKQLISNLDMNLEEALYLYVKLGFSLNDAAVATWKYKYEYMVMRPNVFIHEFMDPNYQTNLYRLIPWPNPTFPSYPSGHSCFASAAAGVFIDFFGNETNFTDRSHEDRTEFRGAARSFSTLGQLAAENAFSRIPLGVHMRMDCTEGLRLGYEIAAAVNRYSLKRERA